MSYRAFAIADDAFLPGLIALLRSLREHEGQDLQITFLVHQRLSPMSLESWKRVGDVYPAHTVIDCSDLFPWAWSAANRARLISLLKFEVLRAGASEPLVYFDTDVILLQSFQGALDLLLASDLQMAAVENKSRCTETREYNCNWLPFNAGVFALRGLEPALSRRLYAAAMLEIEARASRLLDAEMICQPIMNAVWGGHDGRYVALPMHYNFRQHEYFEQHEDNVVALHFVTRTTELGKPWDSHPTSPRDAATARWWGVFDRPTEANQ